MTTEERLEYIKNWRRKKSLSEETGIPIEKISDEIVELIFDNRKLNITFLYRYLNIVKLAKRHGFNYSDLDDLFKDNSRTEND